MTKEAEPWALLPDIKETMDRLLDIAERQHEMIEKLMRRNQELTDALVRIGATVNEVEQLPE